MYNFYIINLSERKDRLEHIQKIFENYKKINFIIIEGIKEEEGWIGCYKSHIKCIKYAKENNLPYIIVLEDDCDIVVDFENKFQNIIEYLENNLDTWDIFLGGITNLKTSKILSNIKYKEIDFINVSEGKTFNFVIYNNRVYNYFIEKTIDKPIDKIWHNKFKAIIPIPFIAKQIMSYSDIEKKIVDYSNRYNPVENNIINYLKTKI